MRALEQCLITCGCIASRLREAPWWPVAPAPYPLGDSLADSEGKAVPSTVVEVMVTHGTGVREPGHPLFIAKLGGRELSSESPLGGDGDKTDRTDGCERDEPEPNQPCAGHVS